MDVNALVICKALDKRGIIKMVLSQDKLNALGEKHPCFQLFCLNTYWTFMCQPVALNPHKAHMEPACSQGQEKRS